MKICVDLWGDTKSSRAGRPCLIKARKSCSLTVLVRSSRRWKTILKSCWIDQWSSSNILLFLHFQTHHQMATVKRKTWLLHRWVLIHLLGLSPWKFGWDRSPKLIHTSLAWGQSPRQWSTSSDWLEQWGYEA